MGKIQEFKVIMYILPFIYVIQEYMILLIRHSQEFFTIISHFNHDASNPGFISISNLHILLQSILIGLLFVFFSREDIRSYSLLIQIYLSTIMNRILNKSIIIIFIRLALLEHFNIKETVLHLAQSLIFMK